MDETYVKATAAGRICTAIDRGRSVDFYLSPVVTAKAYRLLGKITTKKWQILRFINTDKARLWSRALVLFNAKAVPGLTLNTDRLVRNNVD